jgi:hypothetical protein
MALLQRFIAIALVVAVVWFDMNNCGVDADVSPLQLRRLRAAQHGGTTSVFVRGTMAADHQMELYMTMMASDDQDEEKIIASCSHNRYDAAGRIGKTKNDVMSVSRGGGSSSHRSGGGCFGGPVMHMQRTVGQARDVAMNFANTLLLRRRTFFSTPIPSRRRQ